MGGLGVLGGIGVLVAIFAGIFALLWWVSSLTTALVVFFILVSAIMILVILIQKPRGGGLSGAFGGAGGPQQTAFGAKVGDVLTWVTVGAFVLFLGLAMIITWNLKPEADKNEQQVQPSVPTQQQ